MTWAESEAGIHCLREVLVVKVCISFFQSHHQFRERLIVFLKLLHQSLFSGEASYDLWCHWCDALLEERTQYRFPNVRLLRRSLNCSVDAGVVLEWKAGARFRSGNTDALLSDVKFALLLFRLLFMWLSSVGLSWRCIMVGLISLIRTEFLNIKSRSQVGVRFNSKVDRLQASGKPVVDALIDMRVNCVLVISEPR